MKGIFTETLIEFLDRRQHWSFLLVTAVASAIIYFAVNEKLELVKNEISSQASLLQSASSGLSNFVTVIVMLSILSIVFLIPRLSRNGRIEFYLSKPITRTSLFYGKIVSLLVIYGAMILFCGMLVGGVLHFLGALAFTKSIYIIVMGSAAFLAWFAVITFVGIMTGSTSATVVAFAGLWVVQLFLKHRTEWEMEQSGARLVLDFFYHIIPKTSEMAGLSVQLATGAQTVDYLPILTSLILSGILIYSSLSFFRRRDF